MGSKLPQPVTKEEFEKLLEAAKKERDKFFMPRAKRYTPRGERINQYIISMVLGFGAGMRISEIVGFEGESKRRKDRKDPKSEIIQKDTTIPKLTADRLENNMIRIIAGKGQKDRITLLPGKLLLRAGINREELKKNLPLRVSRRAIQLYIEQLGNKVLGKNISFHKLRHGFGSTLAGANRPLHEIQMLMGHSRLDTTGIYLHANPQSAIKGAEDVF